VHSELVHAKAFSSIVLEFTYLSLSLPLLRLMKDLITRHLYKHAWLTFANVVIDCLP
jgi:hypothetical protein